MSPLELGGYLLAIFWRDWDDKWWTCVFLAGVAAVAVGLLLGLGDWWFGAVTGSQAALVSYTLTRGIVRSRDHKQWKEAMEAQYRLHRARLQKDWPDDF